MITEKQRTAAAKRLLKNAGMHEGFKNQITNAELIPAAGKNALVNGYTIIYYDSAIQNIPKAKYFDDGAIIDEAGEKFTYFNKNELQNYINSCAEELTEVINLSKIKQYLKAHKNIKDILINKKIAPIKINDNYYNAFLIRDALTAAGIDSALTETAQQKVFKRAEKMLYINNGIAGAVILPFRADSVAVQTDAETITMELTREGF